MKIASFLLLVAMLLTMSTSVLAGNVITDMSKFENVVCNNYMLEDGNDVNYLVSCSEWAKECIEKAIEIGLINQEANYKYSSPITREEFCELIYEFLKFVPKKEYKADTNVYISVVDVDNVAVKELVQYGIIKGKKSELVFAKDLTVAVMIEEITFAPYDLLTREEAATIIIRVIDKFFPEFISGRMFNYDDANDISEWANDSVHKISGLGFMNGVGNNKFAPKDTCTTEQAIATLVRVYHRIESDKSIVRNKSDSF